MCCPLTDTELPWRAELVLSHGQRVRKLLLMYSDFINCPARCAMFLLELYLWYRGQEFLDLAKTFLYKIPHWEKHWLSDLIYGALMGHAVQTYQGELKAKFDVDLCRNYAEFLGRHVPTEAPLFTSKSFVCIHSNLSTDLE